MKNFLRTISFALVAAILLVCFSSSTVFSFDLKNVLGGGQKQGSAGKEGAISIDSLAESQSGLCKRLHAALVEINTAQTHFANAMGDKEAADRCLLVRESLDKGNLEDKDSIADNVATTREIAERQAKQAEKVQELDEAKKAELQKGLVPYALGTTHTVLLGKDFVNHLGSTKDIVKEAGIAGALTVKKRLDVTIAVAPRIPGLGSDLVNATSTIMDLAKRENLDTSGADEALGEMDDLDS